MPRPGPQQSPRYLRVREVVNRHDPMNLISIGSPEDEYDPEIAEIMDALTDVASPEALSPRLADIFHRWFGGPEHVKFRGWSELADDLWWDAR